MNGRSDAGRNIHHCCNCSRLRYGESNIRNPYTGTGDKTGDVHTAACLSLPGAPISRNGRWYVILRVRIRTGLVKDVQADRSTGSDLLDFAAIRALQQWRFKSDALPPIKVELPQRKDAFATEDSFVRVPVSFVLVEHGVITKGKHKGLSVREAMSRDAQGH